VASDPKDIFPKMPAEVFDLWIRPHISAYGWPFTAQNLRLEGTKWSAFFTGYSLQQWTAFDWYLTTVRLVPGLFHEETMQRIEWVVGACAFDYKTPTAKLENTKERFRACTAFIEQHGKFPQPVVGLSSALGLEIVDGHHRLAALFFLGKHERFDMPIWLAVKRN
jgi:hypothetical protein